MCTAAVVSIGTAVPPNYYTQEEIFQKAGYRNKKIQVIFNRSGIEKRHMCIDPDYTARTDPQWFSGHYVKWAVLLGSQAARQTLEQLGLNGSNVDYLVSARCTGYVCPGISQRLAADLGLASNAKTANLAGMGCNAAIPALERAKEILKFRSSF